MPTAPTVLGDVVIAGGSSFTPDADWADGAMMMVASWGFSSSLATPSGWTLIDERAQDFWDDYDADFGTLYSVISWKLKSGTGSTTFTGADWVTGIALTGIPESPVDAANYSTNTTTAPSITTSQTNDVLIYIACRLGSSWTPPTDMSEKVDADPASTGFRTYIATQILTSSGATGTRAGTISGDPGWPPDQAMIGRNIAIKGVDSSTPKLIIVQMNSGYVG
jgi:hypothetical protein